MRGSTNLSPGPTKQVHFFTLQLEAIRYLNPPPRIARTPSEYSKTHGSDRQTNRQLHSSRIFNRCFWNSKPRNCPETTHTPNLIKVKQWRGFSQCCTIYRYVMISYVSSIWQ